ncbi:MAG TPA: alpha/beta fold hydrolase [Myxococcales bacterium]|jgi:pimeloyl-ACP methyl ester carboxylesterase|nr:alpha/beta fold hydrolase [Myxococcales bacterium]
MLTPNTQGTQPETFTARRASRLALLAAAAALFGCAPPEHVVLVHGAWQGAWALGPVATQLRYDGTKVSVVELPAHGADQTPVSAATLDAYVNKVGESVDAEGQPVVLVGHSMAGMVISQYAERNPAKVKSLVYLAAYLPADGQSLQDLAYTDGDSHLGPALVVNASEGTGTIPQDKLQDVFCADCSASTLDSLKSNYRDEPLAPIGTPVSLTAAAWGSVPKSYVFTTQDNAVSYALQQRMAGAVTLRGSATLETSHSPFLSAPSKVVDALQQLIR